jgi:TusA-related sulfurtransferase
MIRLDARGYSCPEPVIRLRRIIGDHAEIELLVDNQASADVCKRFALSKGFAAEIRRDGQDYVLEMRK